MVTSPSDGFPENQKEPSETSDRDGARTGRAREIQTLRGSGPGLLSRFPGMAYQCRNDPSWTMEFVSEGSISLTGYRPDEIVGPRGMTYSDIVHPEDRERVWAEVQEAVSPPDAPFEIHYRILAKDGDIRTVMERGHSIRSEGGDLLGLEGFITDVTELHKKTQELETSRQMLRALAEQSLFGVYVILHGTFTYVNEAFAKTFGYERSEIVNHLGPMDLAAPEDRETVQENIRRRVDGRVAALGYTFRGMRKDGSRVPVEVHGARSTLDGEPAVSGVLLDVSERRRLEEQVAQAQKMEAVGLLASGIAHDFNNILTAVGGHARLLLEDLSDRDEALEGLDEIGRAADRASALTRQILNFARDSRTSADEPSDLNAAISDVREMVESMTGDNIRLEWSFADDEAWVALDRGGIGQIVMNLAVNARDAMPNGGRLSVRTTIVELDEGYAESHFDVEPGRYVQLSVRDTGEGMPREVRERIFEPFFTTKERGKGTGLGLSTVYGIVRQAGGHVFVYSERGRGTHFKIHLPLMQEGQLRHLERGEAQPASSQPQPSSSLEGSETIFVVDDDPAVRTISCKILQRYGYTVISAGDSEEAGKLFDENASAIDLLVTDVVLPDLSGPQLVERLRIAHGDFPVLFVSGYTEESVNRSARQDPRALFLEKPFDPKNLASAVRRLLVQDGPGRSG